MDVAAPKPRGRPPKSKRPQSAAEMKEHQRLQNRLKQQRFRERFFIERDALQDQLHALQAEVAALPKPTTKITKALPWSEIASIFAEASNEALEEHRGLKAKQRKLLQLSERMAAWVASMSSTVAPKTLPKGTVWGQTTLLAEPTSRRLGLDWYSQHLLHNTDRMLQYSEFPTHGNLADTVILDGQHDSVNVVMRIQHEFDLPLDAVMTGMRDPIWSLLRGDTRPYMVEFMNEELVQSIDTNMIYRRTVFNPEESSYYVCREFSTPDRIVFVTGNFYQDELLPSNLQWCNRMCWFVLERVSPTKTRLRAVFFNASYIVDGRHISWREDAAMSEFDLGDGSEEAQMLRFKQALEEAYYPMVHTDHHTLLEWAL
ncbi:hypothetical protein SDRG_14835 [Saprolegnia diclina VS20]|uniref:BZIP domain-containing protein n=1 Tax=Saprolegnia diclina (strain VS20) TaxID=1156394 RepID=T0PPM3_SAPDV|nr:hypothetical protein SDRG_14835 [Saprolegnia diclina VS20]EQC27394.1 hypothetical protein SDRG_14835 [Saprolegnia diclina VS20]|eukprot:XP_008619213.1 hypothetical protein SDRG_14835 [Saprolegnia diclina VS20]